MIFTKSNFEKYLTDTSANIAFFKNIIFEFLNRSKQSGYPAYSPLRFYDYKFDGVHIEIEIPLYGSR
jgi:hypothetical protein